MRTTDRNIATARSAFLFFFFFPPLFCFITIVIRKIPRQCQRVIQEKSKGSIEGECSRYPTASEHLRTETVLKVLKDRETLMRASKQTRTTDTKIAMRVHVSVTISTPLTLSLLMVFLCTLLRMPTRRAKCNGDANFAPPSTTLGKRWNYKSCSSSFVRTTSGI